MKLFGVVTNFTKSRSSFASCSTSDVTYIEIVQYANSLLQGWQRWLDARFFAGGIGQESGPAKYFGNGTNGLSNKTEKGAK